MGAGLLLGLQWESYYQGTIISFQRKEHTLRSATGTSAAGSLEYRKVVDKCMGGATSDTTFSASSACRD